VRIEPIADIPNQSGVTTRPMDGLTFILGSVDRIPVIRYFTRYAIIFTSKYTSKKHAVKKIFKKKHVELQHTKAR
jgi:hypothetical protein